MGAQDPPVGCHEFQRQRGNSLRLPPVQPARFAGRRPAGKYFGTAIRLFCVRSGRRFLQAGVLRGVHIRWPIALLYMNA